MIVTRKEGTMINYRPIIDGFPLDELDMPEAFKAAVRPVVEYLLCTHASFSVAIRLASLMLESYRGPLRMSDAFTRAHPENRIDLYSSEDVYFAFFLLLLAAKADNLYSIQAERQTGLCAAYSVNSPQDNETCSQCRERCHAAPLADAAYHTVPPFHVACRCGLIFSK